MRDGRRVYYRGQAVQDVTTHPVFKKAFAHASLDYRMAHDHRYRDLAVGLDGASRYSNVPQNTDDLLARSALIEAAEYGPALRRYLEAAAPGSPARSGCGR